MTQTTGEQLAPTLTPAILRGFDRHLVAFVREMEDHGWRGRRGSRNHILMRAPDGQTMCTVTRKSYSRKDLCNQQRVFRTWLRQQETPAPEVEAVEDDTIALAEAAVIRVKSSPIRPDEAITQPDPAPAPAPVTPVDTDDEHAMRNAQYACPSCDRVFSGAQPLSVHRVRAHVKVGCRVCDRVMSPGNLPRHLRKHEADLGTHEQVMREVLRLRAELALARDESAEWQSIAEGTETELTELSTGLRALLGD